ncbi:MAG TPA: TetR/AcrR family transcriptional regulator [Polyangia bacterium]
MVQKLKKQQGEATRKLILEVTARRFAQHGFQGTSLEAIAKQVGVAKSSVLWHFGSKETLLYEVISGVMSKWEKEQTAELLALTDSRERLSRLVEAYKRLMRERPDTLLLFLTVMFEGIDANPELTQKFREMYKGYRAAIKLALELGVQEGAFRKDLPSEDMASFVLAAFDGVFIQWYLDREHFDLDVAMEHLKKVVGRFIDAPVAAVSDKPIEQPSAN